MPHLAGLDQFFDGAGDVLDRHLRIDAMLLVDVDSVGTQSAQRFLAHALDVLGPAAQAANLAIIRHIEPELRAEDDIVSHGCERLAGQFLAAFIDFGRIEKPDSSVVSVLDDSQGRPDAAPPAVGSTGAVRSD